MMRMGMNGKSSQTYQQIALKYDISRERVRGIVEELKKIGGLQDWDWKGREYSPYSSSQKSWKGRVNDCELCVFVPPMGASPITAFCEELICFGAQRIFLLCAS